MRDNNSNSSFVVRLMCVLSRVQPFTEYPRRPDPSSHSTLAACQQVGGSTQASVCNVATTIVIHGLLIDQPLPACRLPVAQ